LRQVPLQMHGRLGMNRQPGCASAREILQVRLRMDHHQMNVEREAGAAPYCVDHLRSEGQVRNELSVHDIDMNPVGATLRAHIDLVAQAREVRAQDRGGDANWFHCHDLLWMGRIPAREASLRLAGYLVLPASVVPHPVPGLYWRYCPEESTRQ